MLYTVGLGIGGDLWPATSTFCSYLASNRSGSYSLFHDRSVLELGSGTGLAGLCIEKLVPSCREIVVTDLATYVPLMTRNIALNGSTACKAGPLDWCDEVGRHDIPGEKMTFDVILALEWYETQCIAPLKAFFFPILHCSVYRENLYVPLIRTILRHMHASSVLILGLTRAFTKGSFFTLMSAHGLRYTRISEEHLPKVKQRTRVLYTDKSGDALRKGGEDVEEAVLSRRRRKEVEESSWDPDIGLFLCLAEVQ